MEKKSTDHMAKFEEAFKRFLDVFMTRRDFTSLQELLGENHCGFGTGLDEVAYSRDKGLEIFQKDIASAPNPLHYTLHHHEIKLLDQNNAIVMAHLDIKTKLMEQDVKMKNLRKMMILHEEDNMIKVSGYHVSFPTEVHAEDESYPLKELEERTKVLHRMVKEKTKSLQKAITELKQSQEALKESEERNRAILNTLPDLLFISSREGRFLDYHASDPELLAIDPNEFLGKSATEVLPEELAELFLQSLREAYRTNQLQIIDYSLGVHGSLRHFEARTTTLDEQRLITIIRDITEQKEKERLLQESKQHLNMLLSNTPAVIYSFTLSDGKQRITYVNNNLKTVLGFEPEEFINNHELFKESLHPEDSKNIIDGSLELINKGRTSLEYRFKNKQGDYHWIHDEQKLYQKTDDQIEVIGTWWDITERKQMEEKMQHQHEFQKIVANISYSFINAKGLRMDEAIHKTLFEIGTFFHVDRSYLFQFSSDDQSMSNTHEWCRAGIKPQIDIIQDQPVDELPWIIKEIRSKEYVFIPDVNTLVFKEEREEFQRQDIQSLLYIPINVEDRVAGFIGMDAVTDKMVWTDEDITLLKVIGEIMSSAFSKHQIEEELMYRNQEVEELNQHLNQEIEKARRIHNNILPKKLPTIEGISFAAFYQPAEKIGGDFYEVIQVDNRVVIYLSDISGHSLDGAMINFFVKEAIHSYISLKPDELCPKSILWHLEQQYRQENYSDELFICIFLAVLDLETMELTYSGAGFQDTPLVNKGNGEKALLNTKGLFINSVFSLDNRDFQERTMTLTVGSTILFNTDGLTEHGEPGAFYRDRLSQVFYENAHLSPDQISKAIVEDFRCFNKGSLQGDDDITFLILQVDPENRKNK